MPGTAEPWVPVVLAAWERGQRLSAVGPGPVAAHLTHSRHLADALDPVGRAVDLGSGAGIPGLALAGWWSDSAWLLVDAAARRVRFLRAVVDELGWTDRVDVVHGRAEDVARRARWSEWADLVVARSFGPPAATAECGARFLAPGGLLVVSEPPNTDADRWPADGLATLGLAPMASPPTDAVHLQRLVRRGPLPEEVPRRAGLPSRRPRF